MQQVLKMVAPCESLLQTHPSSLHLWPDVGEDVGEGRSCRHLCA